RYHELVAHGRGSGELFATSFSNDAGSKQSSLGLFVTAEPYVGQHGRSLRLVGLEPGTNDHALDRALVIHGADYVSATFAAAQGRLGRSLGCPALRSEVSAALIGEIQGGTPLFAYYPDAAWLERSPFLMGACAADR
ncbi:MAG: murein L,D-transpeptidase catalytic domain family protein, partial [Candidatus Binatia bacterium]